MLDTYAKSGGYILGFRIDPHDKLESVLRDVTNFHSLFSRTPIFGVEFSVEAEAANIPALTHPKVEDDTTILDDDLPPDVHAMAAYFAGE